MATCKDKLVVRLWEKEHKLNECYVSYLKKYLKQHNISQKELSNILGVSLGVVNSWLRGGSRISIVLRRIIKMKLRR